MNDNGGSQQGEASESEGVAEEGVPEEAAPPEQMKQRCKKQISWVNSETCRGSSFTACPVL